MMQEKESSSPYSPLELLKGSNFVVAETYPIRTNGSSSDEMGKEAVYTSLSKQGVTDRPTVTFCNSEEERIKKIISSLKNQKALSSSNDPLMDIVSF